jgi:hypothetical protein
MIKFKVVIVDNFNHLIVFYVQEHGSGVDRYREMARVAVSGRYNGGWRGRCNIILLGSLIDCSLFFFILNAT